MKRLPRVLIVEDEPAIAELIAVNLRHNGFSPIWSEDGDSAQRELDASPLLDESHPFARTVAPSWIPARRTRDGW